MTIELLKDFFMWCVVINFAMLFVMTFIFSSAKIKVFCIRMHQKFFNLPEEKILLTIYKCIGAYKILVLVFNLVPYLALIIIA